MASCSASRPARCVRRRASRPSSCHRRRRSPSSARAARAPTMRAAAVPSRPSCADRPAPREPHPPCSSCTAAAGSARSTARWRMSSRAPASRPSTSITSRRPRRLRVATGIAGEAATRGTSGRRGTARSWTARPRCAAREGSTRTASASSAGRWAEASPSMPRRARRRPRTGRDRLTRWSSTRPTTTAPRWRRRGASRRRMILSAGTTDAVPVSGAIALHRALQAAHVPAELHIWPHGRHSWPGAQGVQGLRWTTRFLHHYLGG